MQFSRDLEITEMHFCMARISTECLEFRALLKKAKPSGFISLCIWIKEKKWRPTGALGLTHLQEYLCHTLNALFEEKEIHSTVPNQFEFTCISKNVSDKLRSLGIS